MQLIWIGGPAHRIVSLSWTAKYLFWAALAVMAGLLSLGALFHFMGLRVAMNYSPTLVHSMGGVISQAQMQALETQHTSQLLHLQERMGHLQAQLQTLQTSQTQWIQDLGWKSDLPIAKDKIPVWLSKPGQGGPLLLWPGGRDANATNLQSATEQSLDHTEQAMASLGHSWQFEQAKLAQLPLGSPLRGEFGLSSRFGARADPLTHAKALHEGLDLVADRQAHVLATAPGTVLRSEVSGAYGQMVEVEHAHHYVTRYAHLDRRHVAPGDRVQRGHLLGELGNSGRSTGPHLHYEILYKNRKINPETPLRPLWEDAN